jgi:hypothetical protein
MPADTRPAISADERALMLLLALVHLQQRAPQKAETLYAALVALNPRDTQAMKGIACARLEIGKAQAALEVLDSITDPNEPSATVHLLRARAFAQLGEFENAQVAMRAFGQLRVVEE